MTYRSQERLTTPMNTLSRTSQIVFIDSNVDGYCDLANNILTDIDVVVLDRRQSGLREITRVLSQYTDLRSIHLVAHGEPGAIYLGTTKLDGKTVDRYAEDLRRWVKALGSQAEILLYGCQSAAGEIGRQFLQHLHQLTDASIAASTQIVGRGQWNFDRVIGQLTTPLPFTAKTLATYPGTFTPENALYATGGTDNEQLFVVDLDTGALSSPEDIFPTGYTIPTNPNNGNPEPGTFALSRRFNINDPNDPGLFYYFDRGRGNPTLYSYNLETDTITEINTLSLPAENRPLFKMAQSQDGTIYTMTNGTTNLYRIDPDTGTLIRTQAISGDGFQAAGGDIAFDPDDENTLFASVTLNSAGTYLLYTIDVSTGTASLVGTIVDATTSTSINPRGGGSLAFGADGNLYVTSNSQIFRVDPNTAEAQLIGATAATLTDFASLPIPAVALDITVEKEDGQTGTGSIDSGAAIQYTITLENNGVTDINGNIAPGDITGLEISDVLPADIENVSWTLTVFDGNGDEVPSRGDSGSGDINDVLDLPAEHKAVYTIQAKVVDSPSTGSISNQVDVKAPPGFAILQPDGTRVSTLVDTDTVNINNRPPEAQPGFNNVKPGETISVAGLIGIDPEGDDIQSYTIDTLPPEGTLFLDGQPVQAGDEISAADISRLMFTAAGNFDGSSFTYSAKDVNGGVSSPATITLNNPPTATGGSIDVPASNDTVLTPTPLDGADTDGTVSGYKITSLPDPSDGTLFIGDPDKGGVAVQAGDILTPEQRLQLVFRAEPGFNGGSFEFQTIDDDGALSDAAEVILGKSNTPPETNDNVIEEVPGSSPVQLTGLGGTDAEDPTSDLTFKILDLPDEGTLFIGDPTQPGAIAVTKDQVLTPAQLADLFFEPPAGGLTGPVDFPYAAIDKDGTQDPTPATAFLKPPASNIPPETTETTVDVPPNTATSSTTVPPGTATPIPGLGGSDPDGNIAEFQIDTVPNNGTLYLGDPGNGGTVIQAGDRIPTDRIDELFFLPQPGFSGGSFTYSAIDDTGEADPTPAQVQLTAGNNLPETDGVTQSLPDPGEVLKLSGLGGSDSDGSVAFYTIETLPASSGGVLYLGHPEAGGVPVQAGDVLTPDQLDRLFLQVSSTLNFNDVTFTYSATDNDGAVDPTPATVRLTRGNLPPETDESTVRFDSSDTEVPITGLGGSDEDGSVAFYTLKSLPPESEGILFIGDPANNVRVIDGQKLSEAELNQLVFVPGADFSGTTTFTYAATDNVGVEDPTPATVTLTTEQPATPEPPDLSDILNPTPPNQPNPNVVDLCCPETPDVVAMPEVEALLSIESTLVDAPPVLNTDGFEISIERRLNGTAGDEALNGDSGNDELQGFEGDDTLQGFEGDDFLQGGIANSSSDDLDRDAIAGNQGNDLISGNEGEDTIFAGEGDDLVFGGKATDFIWGDRDSDTIAGDLGDDAIAGDELLPPEDSTAGMDLLYGNGGNDSLNGNANDDTISGGEGDDFAAGGKDNDLVFGDGGNDFLQGNLGDDSLMGSNGTGDATTEADILHGNPGNDVLVGGMGSDTLHGGQDADFVDGGADNDLLFGDRGSDTLMGDEGSDTIVGRSLNPTERDIDGFDLIYGGAGDDFINGNELNDSISGGDGDDRILGGKDDDLIFGDRGADTIKGELGNDTILGSPVDTLEGISDADAIAGNNGDDLIQSGHGDDIVFAGRDNDLVYAGDDNDRVFGDRGDDTLYGGSGNDTVTGGTGNPISGDEADADVVFGEEGDDIILGSQGNDSLIAGDGNDTALGGQNDDIIWGEAGNDELIGDLGNDTLCGNEGDDTLIGANSNLNRAGDGDDQLCGGAGNDLLVGNEGNDKLNGGTDSDTLFGGQGDDTLMGGDGNDLLFGDRGNDSLVGGNGSDGFVLSANANETIADFQQNSDFFVLAGLTFEQLSIVQVDSNTVIQVGGQTIATLRSITASEITEADFR